MSEGYAKGVNGQITVLGDWLTIERKGLGRVGHSKGERRILLASITAVQMRPAGSLANGFIRFTLPGSPDLRGGLKGANTDENAVIFTKKHAAEFEAIREHVELFIAAHHAGVRQAGGGGDGGADPMDSIRRLAELRDAGAISGEEFEAKKKEMLDRI